MEQPQLVLRILDGPHKGARAAIREGLVVGRKEGDLILDDSKMSVRHARVEWRDVEWVLVDLGSSNKIKVEGQRFSEVVLYIGLQLVMGSTVFEVLERPKAVDEPAAESLTWREILSAMLSRAQSALSPREDSAKFPLRPFPRSVRLEFISGVQYGTTWTLGYGPREAGSASVDLPLFDDAAGDSCFHLDTAEGKVLFRASGTVVDAARVRLNGKLASEEPTELRSGDRIEFGKTRIRVLLD